MKIEWRWILLFAVCLTGGVFLYRHLSPPRIEMPFESPIKAVPISFELRKAELIPAEGLEEVTVRGTKQVIFLHPEAELTSEDIRDVMAVPGRPGGSESAITLRLTREGARKMRKLTAGHLEKPLAIVIDDEVVMAPRVNEVLSEHIMISGLEQREADDFVRGFPPR